MKNLIKTIPPFSSKKESGIWFLCSLLALSIGFWFAYTLLAFSSNPARFALEPYTTIPIAWGTAAVLFSLSGYTGLWLGWARLKRKNNS